ncbi:hypothetical protein PG984_016469 [Apiospora sp. TS-2023a]
MNKAPRTGPAHLRWTDLAEARLAACNRSWSSSGSDESGTAPNSDHRASSGSSRPGRAQRPRRSRGEIHGTPLLQTQRVRVYPTNGPVDKTKYIFNNILIEGLLKSILGHPIVDRQHVTITVAVSLHPFAFSIDTDHLSFQVSPHYPVDPRNEIIIHLEFATNDKEYNFVYYDTRGRLVNALAVEYVFEAPDFYVFFMGQAGHVPGLPGAPRRLAPLEGAFVKSLTDLKFDPEKLDELLPPGRLNDPVFTDFKLTDDGAADQFLPLSWTR